MTKRRRRDYSALPQALPKEGYETMSPDALALFLQKVAEVQQKYQDCAFVGGVALRLFCLLKGIPVPRAYGNDVDIARQGVASVQQDRTSDGEWIDIFSQNLPLQPPFYAPINVNGMSVTVASLPHLLARKALAICRGFEERRNVMEKDIVYFNLLCDLVPPQEWEAFKKETIALGHDMTQTVQKAKQQIADALNHGAITREVHPELAEKEAATRKPGRETQTKTHPSPNGTTDCIL